MTWQWTFIILAGTAAVSFLAGVDHQLDVQRLDSYCAQLVHNETLCQNAK